MDTEKNSEQPQSVVNEQEQPVKQDQAVQTEVRQDSTPQPEQSQQTPQYIPPQQYDYAPRKPGKDLSVPMTTWRWFLTLLVMCIPLVNIIMVFVWAFGSNANISKRNYFRAVLLFTLISVVASVVLFIVYGAVFYQTIIDLFDATWETF